MGCSITTEEEYGFRQTKINEIIEIEIILHYILKHLVK